MPREKSLFSPVKCSGCNLSSCNDKTFCTSWKDNVKNDYSLSSIRHTADGFDCALPISIDTYNACSFRCLYCFSNFLIRDPKRKGNFQVKAINLKRLEKFLNYEDIRLRTSFLNRSLLDEVAPKKYPQCAVQWGALGDPFDCIERQHGVGLKMIDLFNKYNQAVRISTKGANLLLNKKYLSAFNKRPELYWVAFSLITVDNDKLALIDKDAPSATERLKAMKVLSEMGVKTSLRMRPIFPGISDSTKKHPKAWRDLLRRSKDAGAQSISMEFSFVPGVMPSHIKSMWGSINDIVGFDLVKFYKKTSNHGSCLRSSRAWKEDLTFAIYEESKKLGLHFGISDPHWKELNDFGCCCGISPDDKVFGGWMRKNATNALLKAKKGEVVCYQDGIPDWAYKVPMQDLVVMTGAKNAMKRATATWADKLRTTWNDLSSPRGPLGYFGGVLVPHTRLSEGDVVYKYKKSKRKNLPNNYFKV